MKSASLLKTILIFMKCFTGIVLCHGLLPAQTGGPGNPTAYALGFSTYLSHTDKYAARFDIFTDREGYAYVLGTTRDKNFPATQ